VQSVPQAAKGGSGAGLWIGIFAVLLLLGGAGAYWYLMMRPAAHTDSAVQVAAGPTGSTTPAEAPPGQPSPQTQTTPAPTSDQPTPTPESSTLVAAPTPNPTTEVIPENPDFAKKSASQPKSQPAQNRPATAPPPSDPTPAQPQRAARQSSGVLHATVEVAQNGEVVFENLPGARLKFTFDHALWQPTISHKANGTQTLVMRSLKQGIQTSCDVRWEIVE
jgi:outer membrane biosynthesis protein TonB